MSSLAYIKLLWSLSIAYILLYKVTRWNFNFRCRTKVDQLEPQKFNNNENE